MSALVKAAAVIAAATLSCHCGVHSVRGSDVSEMPLTAPDERVQTKTRIHRSNIQIVRQMNGCTKCVTMSALLLQKYCFCCSVYAIYLVFGWRNIRDYFIYCVRTSSSTSRNNGVNKLFTILMNTTTMNWKQKQMQSVTLRDSCRFANEFSLFWLYLWCDCLAM